MPGTTKVIIHNIKLDIYYNVYAVICTILYKNRHGLSINTKKISADMPHQRLIYSSAVTRIRTWVSSATTRGTDHYTITAIASAVMVTKLTIGQSRYNDFTTTESWPYDSWKPLGCISEDIQLTSQHPAKLNIQPILP